jgi:hypothetical protein
VSVTVLLPGATETEMVRSYRVDAATRTMASLLPRGAFTRMLGSMSAQLRAKQTAAHLA